MQIEIEFHPDDGPVQTLYANLSVKDVERLEADTANPAKADDVVSFPARLTKNGPTKEWLFRVGRLKIYRRP